ncbi:MAG: hypothetical protein ACMG55_05410, partial [Microcoleus sp.]
MSEQLSHSDHNKFAFMGEPILDRTEELHELAIDLHKLGKIALASEVEAAHIVGQTSEVVITNRVTKQMLRPKFSVDMMGENGINIVRSKNQSAVESDMAFRELQEEMTALSTGGQQGATDYISEKLGDVRKGYFDADQIGGSQNKEIIFEGAKLPELFALQKEQTAKKHNIDPSKLGWSQWLNIASDTELINFSQWYTSKVNEVLNPDTRENLVG